MALHDQDVYVNVTGGVRVEEPAADLGVALAIASAFYDRPVAAGSACFGEVGVTGDVRFVAGAPRRMAELRKLGYQRIIAPDAAPGGLRNGVDEGVGGKVEVDEVGTLGEAVRAALAS
jgi:DNA repair protein RadA/Sms